jgi:hypothetical protein
MLCSGICAIGVVVADAWAEMVRDFALDAQLVDALRQMPADQAQAAVASWYDAYLNGLYRSLKSWRRGNELGGRMEAAQTADYLLHLLFALERHWRPYSSRLIFHLDKPEPQGWRAGEVGDILLDLIRTGDPGTDPRWTGCRASTRARLWSCL